jgi:PKD repeat protein
MNNILSNKFILFTLALIGLASCEKDAIYLDPILKFEIQLMDSIAPANVSFLNNSANLEYFEWDFGDGTTSHEFSPDHFFGEVGEYTITLRAWNDQEEFSSQKTIYLSKVYVYLITNNSTFKLYNLIAYSIDSSKYCPSINFGMLDSNRSSDISQSQIENLYVSFENDEGIKFKTAFPFQLTGDGLNELVIDRYTLVVMCN